MSTATASLRCPCNVSGAVGKLELLGYVEQGPDPSDRVNKIYPQKDWEEGGNWLQLLGWLRGVCRQGGRNPEKAVITDPVA